MDHLKVFTGKKVKFYWIEGDDRKGPGDNTWLSPCLYDEGEDLYYWIALDLRTCWTSDYKYEALIKVVAPTEQHPSSFTKNLNEILEYAEEHCTKRDFCLELILHSIRSGYVAYYVDLYGNNYAKLLKDAKDKAQDIYKDSRVVLDRPQNRIGDLGYHFLVNTRPGDPEPKKEDIEKQRAWFFKDLDKPVSELKKIIE